MLVKNGTVELAFPEANLQDNAGEDPYEFSTPENMLNEVQIHLAVNEPTSEEEL